MSTGKPKLKQFGDLCPADFDHYPVWIACHNEDQAEPWFDEMDEDTIRPWTGALPVSPSDGILLVRSGFQIWWVRRAAAGNIQAVCSRDWMMKPSRS